MKRNPITRTLGILLSLLLLAGITPLAALPVAAQNITGLMYASTVIADQGVVLMGDTHLYMDIDLSVPYIEGDYNLTIDGSGRLTVNGSDNGIDVKSLHCTSDLFVQPGWHAIEVSETVYIHNTESFIVGGIYAGGHIDIQSNNATIGGNGNAIFSSLGNITLSGGTFDIGANGIAVEAETGGIYMTGAFTVNSNNDRTIHAARGEVVIDGSLKSTSGAQFDPDVHFINRDNISICARAGFSFYGTTLEVEGLGGIGAGNYNGDADISIT
ncbi:MAG: carbohydrate-binding domain-containing protein, partial [Clostridia bacterium]|nr:carbohydrate-binding domain-containing protein [Clostridia bacterium]